MARLIGRAKSPHLNAPAGPLPPEIAAFIVANHVLSLAVRDGDGLWSASCFYAADLASADFIILSALKTRHGAAMLAFPEIAGSIAGQPSDVAAIEGVQFSARALRLEGQAREAALALYTARHPIARLVDTDVWRLCLGTIKHTSNRTRFGHKTLWRRPSA